MCLFHWRRVPKRLQQGVWAAYVPGQERTKTPSETYLLAAFAAIEAVAEQEGQAMPPYMLKRLAAARQDAHQALPLG